MNIWWFGPSSEHLELQKLVLTAPFLTIFLKPINELNDTSQLKVGTWLITYTLNFVWSSQKQNLDKILYNLILWLENGLLLCEFTNQNLQNLSTYLFSNAITLPITDRYYVLALYFPTTS